MIGSLDIIITIAYILLIITMGLWAGKRKKDTAKTGSGDYFLAGKTLRWPMISLALFATNISCFHLISLAQNFIGLLSANHSKAGARMVWAIISSCRPCCYY